MDSFLCTLYIRVRWFGGNVLVTPLTDPIHDPSICTGIIMQLTARYLNAEVPRRSSSPCQRVNEIHPLNLRTHLLK